MKQVAGLLCAGSVVVALLVGLAPSMSFGDRQVEIEGKIESLPTTSGWIGVWTVGGAKVVVDGATRIDEEDGPVAVGAYVEVEGVSEAEGIVRATEIEVERTKR